MKVQACRLLTDSGGRWAARCLRGGRGLTWVTWRRGEPLVGRVERHSQDAEWVRGAEWGGAEGVGEGLGSSPRPTTRWSEVKYMSWHSTSFMVLMFRESFSLKEAML